MDYRVRFQMSGIGPLKWGGLGVNVGYMIIHVPGSDAELYYDLSGVNALGIVPKIATDSILIPASTPRLPVMTSKNALRDFNIKLSIPTVISFSGNLYNILFELRGPSHLDSGTGAPPIYQYSQALEVMGLAVGGAELVTSLRANRLWDGVPRDLLTGGRLGAW